MALKVILLLVAAAVMFKNIDASCCRAVVVQEPLVLQTCPVVNYVPKTCGCPSTTCCDTPCSSCFKDLSNVCATCPEKEKPACACLKAAAKDSCGCNQKAKSSCGCDQKAKSSCCCDKKAKSSCGCDQKAKSSCCCDKQAKSFIFFPEVEYPMTILEVMEPFYYNTCFGY